tara:strand:- start:770 stop:1504 length:735 start_codon:yes stop_codon:yes gene_type:complete
MVTILKKELYNFIGSLSGLILIFIFSILNGLFLWVFPGSFNLLDSNYAGLDGMFFIAPWLFLFLVPALTMRFFADEFKSGTIEILLTKPITEFELIIGKYLAGHILCIFAILPTLIYVVSIYHLGQPQGNLDFGATFGSYIGLVFLSGIYVSIGLFTSSLTENQILAFLLALFLCFFSFYAFDQIALMMSWTGLELYIEKLGINYHYNAISCGVMDTRDIAYFISIIILFLMGTKLSIQIRKYR